MKTKSIVRVVLLAFVVASVGWLIARQAGSVKAAEPTAGEETTAPAPNPAAQPAARPDRVVVYYFHTTSRCPTCLKIEAYTREAVETGFAPALKDGRLEFLVLNVDEAANAHFVQDYQLSTKSVIVSDVKDGKQTQWQNLTRVWELTGDKPAFIKYVQDGINQYLKGK